jgi:hypothetical protein
MNQITIEVPCEVCGGTGLLRSAALPTGVAAICYGGCNKGRKQITIDTVPEKEMQGIERVVLTWDPLASPGEGADITGSISIEEWRAGKMPTT